MEALYLEVQPRDLSMNANNLRMNDLVVAEYYGKGVENKSFQMDYQSFRKVFRKAGKNTVITLKDGDKELNVLVKTFQRHPVTDKFLHVDFVHVDMKVKVKTSVRLEFTGLAPAVKNLAGRMSIHLDKINLECLPKDLVHAIEVPLESLVGFDDAIRIKDLELSKDVTILHDVEDIIVTVNPPKGTDNVDPLQDAPMMADDAEETA